MTAMLLHFRPRHPSRHPGAVPPAARIAPPSERNSTPEADADWLAADRAADRTRPRPT